MTATGTTANAGGIVLTADTTAQITADVEALSVSAAVSMGSNGTTAVSIGAAIANNFIGWDEFGRRRPARRDGVHAGFVPQGGSGDQPVGVLDRGD